MKASSENSMDKPTAIVASSLLDLGEEARQPQGSLEFRTKVLVAGLWEDSSFPSFYIGNPNICKHKKMQKN